MAEPARQTHKGVSISAEDIRKNRAEGNKELARNMVQNWDKARKNEKVRQEK